MMQFYSDCYFFLTAVGQSFEQVYEPVEAKNSRQIGLIASLAFVSVFMGLLAIDIMTYWRVAIALLTKNIPFMEPLLKDLQKVGGLV